MNNLENLYREIDAMGGPSTAGNKERMELLDEVLAVLDMYGITENSVASRVGCLRVIKNGDYNTVAIVVGDPQEDEVEAANHKIKRLQQQVRGLGYAPLFEEE